MRYRSTAVLTALVVLVGVAMLPANVAAQHCPYDGGNMLVVRLTDSRNKLIGSAAGRLSLNEIDNPNAGACKYAEGILARTFLPPLDAFMFRYKRQGEDAFQTFCKDCSYTKDGFYAVVLTQAENVCMAPPSAGEENSRYRRRKFEIRYSYDGTEQVVKVPEERIYSMCLGSGQWSRVEPIEFRIDR